jgi:heat shock protein HspQ
MMAQQCNAPTPDAGANACHRGRVARGIAQNRAANVHAMLIICFRQPSRRLWTSGPITHKNRPEDLMTRHLAKYHLGQIVRHRKHPFRGVIFDVDPEFSNTEEWYDAIPEEARPRRDQPFYHLLAENDESFYVAYVSEQNLVLDESGEPVDHPDLGEIFGEFRNGHYPLQMELN